METVSIREARKRLSALISAVERGESVVITRRGKEVARIGPAAQRTTKPLPDLSEFRASIKIKGKSLSETVIEARRSARY